MNRINHEALIHDSECFTRDHFLARRDEYGFRNLQRMEIFLWDIEIYAQIQRQLYCKVALKGGAAAQLYIPVANQRTSVDIDLICTSEDEMQDALTRISHDLGSRDGLLAFRPYIPSNPTTKLPMKTFFVTCPSVCWDSVEEPGCEIKLDILFHDELPVCTVFDGVSTFAVDSREKLVVVSPDALFGDKLLVLAHGSVGIQDDRMDEAWKQVYDLTNLMLAST